MQKYVSLKILAGLFLTLFLNMNLSARSDILFYQTKNNTKISQNDQNFIQKCLNLTDSDSGIPNAELAQLKRFINQIPKANAVYARQLRKFDGDFLTALNTAASQILPEKIFKDWVEQQRIHSQAAYVEYQKHFELARKNGTEFPKKPEKQFLYAEFPAVSDWVVTPENFDCALETATVIAELGQKEKAFKICETLARREGVERLAVHELYAEIRSGFEEYKEALACLKAGEDYAKVFQKDYRNANKAAFDARLKRYQEIRNRIQRLSAMPNAMKWYNPDLSEEGLFLRECELKIDEGSLSQKDFDALKKKIPELSGKARIYAVTLIAKCARTADGDPGKSLTILIPMMTEKSMAEKFVKDYRAAFKKSMNDYQSAVQKKEAPPLHPLEALQVPLPEFKSWTLSDANGCAVVELARSLEALGKNAEAVELLLVLRPKLKCVDYIAATEFGGRLLLAQNELKKADEACRHAFNMLPHLATLKNGRTRPDKSGVTERLRSRLNALRSLIDYRLEAARFGEGFVVYRDAERARLEQKNFVRAYELYQRVLSVDSGVYAEAANAYTVKCLLHFGTEEGTAELKRFIDERSKVLEAKANALKELKKARLLGGFNRKLQKSIDQNQKDLNRLRTIPFDVGARKAAVTLTEKALAKNEFGLYRGEMLTDIGLFFADENCDFKNAEMWLSRADGWFEKAVMSDANLNEFAVFGEAAAVTAPPPAPRYQDRFGNVLPSVISPGMLFNRQTSDWYIMNQRKQIALYLGLFAFANGKRDLALTHWEKLAEFDPYLKESPPTVYSRLKAIMSSNRKLFVVKDEVLAEFKGKMKNALFLAEINYQFENWEKSHAFYEKIRKGKYGKINKEQLATAVYGAANTQFWISGLSRKFEEFAAEKKRDEFVNFMEKYIPEIRNTKMEPLILRVTASISVSIVDRNKKEKMIKLIDRMFERVIDRYPNSEEAEEALHGKIFYSEDYDTVYTIEQCRKYLKKYPKGDYAESVKNTIEKLQ